LSLANYFIRIGSVFYNINLARIVYYVFSKSLPFTLFTMGICMFNMVDAKPTDNVINITEPTNLELLAYRFRADFTADLNVDSGWAAAENQSAKLIFDQPFRLRIQVGSDQTPPEGVTLGLQYRIQDSPWLSIGVANFPYPSFATPIMSVIATDAYTQGADTDRLLGKPDIDWEEGAGLNAVATTNVWKNKGDAREWEWPLVVRRFSDGPTFAKDNTAIELRVVDGKGKPINGRNTMEFKINALPGHLGGTFIETPGRIGPYQTAQGDLYFFIEPSETDNRFMAIRSTDFGRSWQEVDGEARPIADDLEGVSSVRVDNTIHIIHQVTHEVFYHAFELGSSNEKPGRWLTNSQSIAKPSNPPTQFTDIVARSDGSLIAFYAGHERLQYQIRSREGKWGLPHEIDVNLTPVLSGPVMVNGENDTVTMAYTGQDGSGFIRHLTADNNLSPRILLSSNLGISDAENGAIAPLINIVESGSTQVIYRESNGFLYERRFSTDGKLTQPVLISKLKVVTNAVDSEQVGADVVRQNSKTYLLFIEESSRSIYYTHSNEYGVWSKPMVLIENINGSWVRGSVHKNSQGNPVYGFVYDAGSTGGSGFNRYFALPLQSPQ